MTTPEIIITLVVLLVGVPSMWRNVTAVALVLSWSLGQAVWMISGDNLPLRFYVIADIAVIGIILGKTIRHCAGKTYSSAWHQFCCFFTDLTPCDRVIALIFVAGVWPAYVLEINDFTKWWFLYFCTVAQFLLAGAEALLSWREAKRASPVAEPDIPSSGGFMRIARVGGHD